MTEIAPPRPPPATTTTKAAMGSTTVADCLGRVPYASLIALLLCWVGVALFCAMEYQALDASQEMATRFHLPLPFGDPRLAFIVLAVIMVLFGIVLLIVGALATGTTRSRVYSGWRARLGGRVSCAVFMALTYLLKLCWLAVYTLAVVLAFIYLVFRGLCAEPGRLSFPESSCLNFTVFTPLFNQSSSVGDELVFCGGRLRAFCSLSDAACTWYLVGLGAAAVVVLALVHFLICLAANYAHIKDGSKYMELQDIWQNEDNELPFMSAPIKPSRRY